MSEPEPKVIVEDDGEWLKIPGLIRSGELSIYLPAKNEIHMPSKDLLWTIFLEHELAHWTQKIPFNRTILGDLIYILLLPIWEGLAWRKAAREMRRKGLVK